MATYAVHRLNGIATPANAAYSASELAFQLRSSGAKALVTCVPLLKTAREAAEAVGILPDRIYLMETAIDNADAPYASLDDLIGEGRVLPDLEPLAWTKGQGARQVAYLFYSSGTSGLPVSRPTASDSMDGTGAESKAESCQGLASQHHRQRDANIMARVRGEERKGHRDPGFPRLATAEPHLRLRNCGPE